MQWLIDNANVVQAVASCVMLLIWGLYLQLFYRSYRRQRQSELLITEGPGVGTRAHCFIANLGLEPVFILGVFVEVNEQGRFHRVDVTDRRDIDSDSDPEPAHTTRQGPLASGGSKSIGTFANLLGSDRFNADKYRHVEDDVVFDMTVVAASAANAGLVGASRRFVVRASGEEPTIKAATARSVQIRSGWRQRRLKQVMDDSVQQ